MNSGDYMGKYAYRYLQMFSCFGNIGTIWRRQEYKRCLLRTSRQNFLPRKQENFKQIRNTRSCLITSAARQFSGDRIFRLNCNAPRRRGNSYSQKVATPCFLTFLSTTIIRSNLSLIQSHKSREKSHLLSFLAHYI